MQNQEGNLEACRLNHLLEFKRNACLILPLDPHSIAKASPDCVGEVHGSFATDGSNISGFSHMHDSGMGSAISLGKSPLFPQYCVNNLLANCKFMWSQCMMACSWYAVSLGYFDITLANGICSESTVTAHAALHRFTFPSNTNTSYYGKGNMNPMISLNLADLCNMQSQAAMMVM